MASFISTGLDDLMLSMEKLIDIPDAVVDDMLTAGAEIVAEAQRKNARTRLNERGQSEGITAESIAVKKPIKSNSGGRSVLVRFEGSRADENGNMRRNAEVAFLNEYGVPSKGIAPRQFIRLANEEAADKAVEAERDVYDTWLNSLGL